MKRNWITLLSLVLVVFALVFAGCGKDGDAPAKEGEEGKEGGEAQAPAKPDVKQAEMVWALFVACRDNKVDDFKKVWSKKRTEELKEAWDEAFKEFGGEVIELLGKDFKLADFKFKYEGDDKKGKIIGTFKDKKLPKLRVALEDGVWMVDES